MLQEIIDHLPNDPGVYRYYDENGTIIYVGKATSLKSRVKSYFTGSNNTKTQHLVASIRDIQYTIVNSATEALLLENNLIKKHKPKYNILLKDDKTYPYIKITNEEYPRAITTRRKEKDGAKYFGPFSSEGNAKILVDTINDLFPLVKLANCGKREPCLYYHTQSCMAPCHFKVSKKDYTDMTKKAVAFFEGDYSEILSLMRSKMERASEEMQFELAMEYRDKMTRILRVKDEQNVMLDQSKSVDIIATKQKDDHFAIAIFSIRKGALIVTMSDALDTFLSENEAMAAYLEQYYNDSDERPREVYLMHEMERTVFDHLGIRVSVPQRGDKRKMIDMVRKNANDALHKHIMKTLTKVDRSEAALSEIKTLTGLESAKTIEMFDNSNIQGSDAVSAMVSFVGGVPNKDGYRKFKVKTIVGADDVGTMREIVTRRYSRLKDEGAQMPDLVLIDGALAQVRAAKSALDEVGVSLPVFGLAKDDRHRTSHLVRPDGEEILLTGYSNAKRLLTHIQEEVHRFAITFFRKTKQKSAIVSQLDGIKGLGTKRKQLLLTHFKSVKGIAKATVSDIEAIGIPKEVANAILDKIKETP